MTTLGTRFGQGIVIEQAWEPQGEQARRARRMNVGDNERAVSVAAGAILALQGLSRGSLIGLLTAGVGGMLVYRGVSGD